MPPRPAIPSPALVERMRGFRTSVFARMSALAQQTGAINLGQGFPDSDGPAIVLDTAIAAIRAGDNQYPPLPGTPELRAAIAAHQHERYRLDVDPDREVLVTMGATEAIAAAVLALCEPGDEVVVFEPSYDSYAAVIALAGAVARPSVLRFPDFGVDEEGLRAAFGPRTRLVLLNTPHNPTGKVFSAAELALIARLAREHDAIVIADEVYEHLVYSPARHVPIATLRGMDERTLTVSSAGKTFATTGWKVGWVHGPTELVDAVRTVKQFLTFAGAAPFEPAVAAGLALPPETFTAYADGLAARRDVIVAGLSAAGLPTSSPDGTYFVIADASGVGGDDAESFCLDLPRRVGVVAIPVSAFCADGQDAEHARGLVRFAFCKRMDVIEEAAARLARLTPRSAPS